MPLANFSPKASWERRPARPDDFAVIDFEASSLEDNSYPIEVGLVIVHGLRIVASWSSLIRPTAEWKRRDAWSRRSERVHGISRDALADAPPPSHVLAELIVRAEGFRLLHCDGGDYDLRWFRELTEAAGTHADLEMADIGLLVGGDHGLRGRLAELLAASPAPHRAEADAYRLAAAILDVFPGEGEHR